MSGQPVSEVTRSGQIMKMTKSVNFWGFFSIKKLLVEKCKEIYDILYRFVSSLLLMEHVQGGDQTKSNKTEL